MKLSKSFYKGFGKAINLAGSEQYKMMNPSKDSEMLRGDWENVGQSIAKGIAKYKRTAECK